MHKTYREMTDAEIKTVAKAIITSSSSEEEVKQRLRDELGYQYTVAICSQVPTSVVGVEVFEIMQTLGGLVMKNGAMVMASMYGHDGIINL